MSATDAAETSAPGEDAVTDQRPSHDDIVAALAPRHEDLVALRRHLHAHPETSRNEHATTELVAERLRVAGLEPVVLKTGTGLVCDIGDVDGGAPVVALRADIDALAMADTKEVAYRSQNPGVAHACGHDAHTAIVLGAGLVLNELLREHALRGAVRLMFEPAEEAVPSGALDLVAEGWMARVGAVFGLHCDPRLDVGEIGVRAGALTSAADMVEIRLAGPGGHTARPELTVDLVAVAARLAVDLPQLLTERSRDHGDLRLVFGALSAGEAANVIPSTAVLRASLRTPDREAWDVAGPMVRQALHDLVDPSGATWTLDHRPGIPPVLNDPAATTVLGEAARAAVGPDGVVEAPRSWGADSFAWFLDHAPGSYARLGVRTPGAQSPPVDLHAGGFDIDERAIGIGVRLLTEAALRSLTTPLR